MSDKSFELVTQDHYFRTDGQQHRFVEVGSTIADLVAASGIPERFHSDIEVHISKGRNSTPVARENWSKVRPGDGSHVHIYPSIRGPLAGVILSAILPKVAGLAAGALFAGGIGFKIAVAVFTIVGTLAINALIPPPEVPKPNSVKQDNPNFSITGTSNAENRYGIYPIVLGRHMMFPPKTARGYTEGSGNQIYYRGRFTFGYGPVSLESLRIGTTPITDFENVQIEFRNVDQARTLAAMPELAGKVYAWRSGAQSMSLYPSDIAEDTYSVRLNQNQAVVRETQDRCVSVQIDITFQGLVRFDDNNGKNWHSVAFRYRYRKVGSAAWTNYGNYSTGAYTTANHRFSLPINLGEPARYEIEVMRVTVDSDDAKIRDDSYLTGIRSIRSGGLPSHADTAEVAVRIKASDQLNGQLDSLNGVVQQLAPVWTGSAWTSPQPVRHPAWVYARSLMGPMLRSPAGADRIQLDDLKAWSDQEPHWTCDMVIDQPTSAGEVLDMICAAGRARRTLRDLKYSVVRDGGAGPVVQQFTPHNSRDFRGEIAFPKEIHGFRVRCLSERLDWQQDEITVYADGYNASNASEFETLELQGVVLSKADTTGGNAWRLGRYHLAQAILRPEIFEWTCDIDQLRVNMGDKVRIVHDVPLIGIGSGRVSKITQSADGFLATVTLNEFMAVAGVEFRMRVRQASGDEVVFRAHPPEAQGGAWSVVAGEGVSAAEVSLGDLVLIEEVTQESMEILVKTIRHLDNLQATLIGVPAAPQVLNADTGTIPPYQPNITNVVPRENLLPPAPQEASSEVLARANPARVEVEIVWSPTDPFDVREYLVDLVFPSGERERLATTQRTRLSAVLPEVGEYAFEVFTLNKAGYLSPPLQIPAVYDQSLHVPENVSAFRVQILGETAQFTWERGEEIVSHYHIKFLAAGIAGGWQQAQTLEAALAGTSLSVPALDGTYFIRAVSVFGEPSSEPRLVEFNDADFSAFNVVSTISAHPEFAGQRADALFVGGGELVLGSGEKLSEWGELAQVRSLAYGTGVADSGEFILSETVDLTEVYVSRLSLEVSAYGQRLTDALSDWTALSGLENLAGAVADDQWNVELYLRRTDDDPNAENANWGDWEPFLIGDYRARGIQFQARLISYDPVVAVRLRHLVINIDMPDRLVAGGDVHCPAEGKYVAFDPPFKEQQSVNLTGQELISGVRAHLSQITREGFFVRYLDEAGNGVPVSFDWQAKGYGRVA